MSIISFESIPITLPHGNVPIMSMYDPTWGFFIFGQSVENQHNENQEYISQPTFTIQGVFTCDAEASLDPSIVVDGEIDYTEAFARITTRYNALVSAFNAKAVATAPDSPENWNGPNDPRTIVLPDPLRDANNQAVYALPTSIAVEESRFGISMRYTATLTAGITAPAVLMINGFALWMGRLDIQGPKPIVNRTKLIAAEGTLLHIMNYERPSVTVNGLLPIPADAHLMGENIRLLGQSLMDGPMRIDIYRWTPQGGVTQGLFANLAVEAPSISIRRVERGASISVRGLV